MSASHQVLAHRSDRPELGVESEWSAASQILYALSLRVNTIRGAKAVKTTPSISSGHRTHRDFGSTVIAGATWTRTSPPCESAAASYRLTGRCLLLCYVGHHDVAYRWAEPRRNAPATEAAQARWRIISETGCAWIRNPPARGSHLAGGGRRGSLAAILNTPVDELLYLRCREEWRSRPSRSDGPARRREEMPAKAANR